MTYEKLTALLKAQSSAMLDAIEILVNHESPSRDKAALDKVSDLIAVRFHAIGGAVEKLANPQGGDHLRIRFGDFEGGAKTTLVLGHFDTVWPIGTIETMPFHVADGRARGPGIFDMKSSLVITEYAISGLKAAGIPLNRPVELLFTSDEEIGSVTSRGLIEEFASRAAQVLVLEPPLSGNRFKTARKGVGGFTVEVIGKAAHAGVEPEKGINAIVELAHQILAIGKFADREAGTTLNVGVVHGGTTVNVVPAVAIARIDVRAVTASESRRIEAAMAGLSPVLPGATLKVTGGFNRPPMERTPGVAALFERARAVGGKLGFELGEGSTGGGSDGNFTAAIGVPTLDGLGVPGSGAHAIDEHIVVASLPERATLLAALLTEL